MIVEKPTNSSTYIAVEELLARRPGLLLRLAQRAEIVCHPTCHIEGLLIKPVGDRLAIVAVTTCNARTTLVAA